MIKIFSGKYVSIICLVIAILLKTAFSYYYFQLDTDKLSQAMAAKNLAEGHGISIKQVHITDLSKPVYEPLLGWPPAYTILLAGLYILTHDLATSCFIIDILSIIAFFLLLRALLKLLEFPAYLANLLILFNGVIFIDNIQQSTPTDLPALVFCMYALLLVLRKWGNSTAIPIAFITLINLMPAFLRYMYIPAVFVIPVFLTWNGWMKKDKQLAKKGIVMFSISLAAIIALLLFQKWYTGSATYVTPTERGVFWSNLVIIYPFLFSSFINLNFLFMQVSVLTGISYHTLAMIVRWTNFFLLVGLVLYFFKYSLKRKFVADDIWQAFVFISGLFSLAILSVLGYLSLTISLYYPPPLNSVWTYVGDGRYYIYMMMVILIVFWKWLIMGNTRFLQFKKILRYLFTLVLIIEISHGAYFLGKHFTFDRRFNKDAVRQRELVNYVKTTVEEYKKKNINIVFANNYSKASYAVLFGGNGLLNRQEVNAPELYTSVPTVLLLLVKDTQAPFYKPFFKRYSAKLERKVGDYYVYTGYIAPNK